MARFARWEMTSGIAGVGAAVSLGLGDIIAHSAHAPLSGPDAEYARILLTERMKWEWVTLTRLIGGTLVLWFAALLADRLRHAEGEPGRLAETGFGLGVIWAGVWLLSAFFNSASIVLATDYADAAGSRIAGVLAAELPAVLTAGVVFTLLLTTSLVTARSTAFPKAYGYATGGLAVLMLALALIDWYRPTSLGRLIVSLALLWTAATSLMLLLNARWRADSPEH
jgi:hypothetical protein